MQPLKRSFSVSSILPLVCLLLIAALLVGCGSNAPSTQSADTQAAPTVEEPTEPPSPTLPPTLTDTPEPTATPTETFTPEPTATPTETPTFTPTPVPTEIGGGGYIAYSSTRLGSSYTHPYFDLMLLNPNNGRYTRISADAKADHASPDWSPDGSMIAYTEDGLPFLLNPVDRTETKIPSPFGSSVYHPSWSPDGKVTFSYAAPGKYPQVWRSSIDGSDWAEASPNISFQFDPDYSPDGTTYIFAGSPGEIFSEWIEFFDFGFRLTAYDIPPRDLFLVDVTTNAMRPLTVTEDEDEYEPAWSPDGQRLAFVRLMDNSNPEIFLANADGTGEVRLTNHLAVDVHPTWSPDGTLLAFASDRDGNYEIYLLEIATLKAYRLTDTPVDDLEPTWSPVGVPQPDADVDFTASRTFYDIAQVKAKPLSMEDLASYLMAEGFITKETGKLNKVYDHTDSLAQMYYYPKFPTYLSPADFILRTNATWEAASDKADWFSTGCAFVFREQPTASSNHYVIWFGMDGYAYMGRQRNDNYTNVATSNDYYPVDIPKDSGQLILVAEGQNIYFFVNGLLLLERVDTLFTDGDLYLSLISGTNKGFGTKCTMKDIMVYELKP